jgi:conjugal transfer mating pair stabilization protein TraN
MSQMSDCSQLEGLGCTFLRENCLSEDTPCMNVERVYSCPIPPVPSQSGEICDGDIFCLNGECDQIDREPNTDFKDAVVALNAIAQAGKEFDPNNLTVFRGEAMSCTKTIFGLTNCCVPRGFPLLGGCSAGDAALKERREKGECTYVGTWCSSRFLGICLQRRERHCCFLSKISRILQEQGRPQIGKAWGAPRDEQCLGFTIAEFQQLDLSRMDFSEVYAEFTEAARLPEELATVTSMQAKITAYFQANQ